MNPPLDASEPTDVLLFRPAVSPRTSTGTERGAGPDRLLGPFSGAPRASATGEALPSAPQEVLPEPEEVATTDDAVWLEFDEPEPFELDEATAALVAATPAEEAEEAEIEEAEIEEAEADAWPGYAPALELEPVGEEEGEAGLLEPVSGEAAAEPLLGEELIGQREWEYGFDSLPPEPAPPAPAAARPAAELGPKRAPRPVLDEVAARLEGIARTLRDRTPAELLGRADDPLQLLIAGYVLGLSEASRAPAEDEPERE